MGCPKLTYHTEFIPIWMGAAHEKIDPVNFLTLGGKKATPEKSIDYYPFGLQTANSWTRENTTGNSYLYNAANELNQTTGWYEMFYRGYDPALGRMLQVDPYAHYYTSHTPYNYAVNNPIIFNDPTGGKYEIGPMSYSVYAMYFGEDRPAEGVGGGGGSFHNSYGGRRETGVNEFGQPGYWITDPTTTSYTDKDGNLVIHGVSDVFVPIDPSQAFTDGGPMAAATAASLVLLADDVSGVGTIDDILIPFLFAAAYAAEYAGKGNENYPGPLVYTVPDPTTTPPPFNEPDPENYFPSGGNGLIVIGGILGLMSDLGENTLNTLGEIGDSIENAYDETVSFYKDVANTFNKGISRYGK